MSQKRCAHNNMSISTNNMSVYAFLCGLLTEQDQICHGDAGLCG